MKARRICVNVAIISVLFAVSLPAVAAYRGLFIWGNGAGLVSMMRDAVESAICFANDANWVRITIANSPTERQLVRLINRAFAGANDEDTSVLVISSHGTFGADLAPVDEGAPGALDLYDEYVCLGSTIIDDSFGAGPVGVTLAGVRGSKIVILNSCFSGGIAGGAADLLPTLPSTLFLHASTEAQKSFGDFGNRVFGHPHSFFLGSLVSGLLVDAARPGIAKADTNADGAVDVAEWMGFAVPKIAAINAKFGGLQSPGSLPVGSPLLAAPLYTPSTFWPHAHADPEEEAVIAPPLFPSALSPVAEALYDKLVDIDDGGTVIKQLAQSWEYVDERTVTLHLKKGVRFHDGTDLTAEHVAANLQMELALIPGVVRPSLKETGVIADVRVIDDYTIEIELPDAVPMGVFLEGLSGTMGMIAHPDADPEWPMGTGPFKAKDLGSYPDTVILERFDDYWNGPASATQLIFVWVEEETTARLMLENGDLHILQCRGAQTAARLEESAYATPTLYGGTAQGLFPSLAALPIIDDQSLFTAVGEAVEGFVHHPDDVLRLERVSSPDEEGRLIVGLCDGP